MKWFAWLTLTALALVGAHLVLGALEQNRFDPDAYLAKRGAYSVTIKRDTWGVPHVEGTTDADVAFAFAYAQAEDAYPIMEEAIRFYRGEQAAQVGFDGIALDYLIQLLEIWPSIHAGYEEELSPEARALLEGFSDGINYWAARHPDEVDRHLYPVTPQDIVAGFAIQHLLFYGFQNTVLELFGDERKRSISLEATDQAFRLSDAPPVPVGSNAFAVAPNRSSDGHTRLLLNSHQPLTGPVAWYEAHLTSKQGWHIMGGAFPGTPLITIGINDNVGWGATVNKPDLVDVYVLTINPDDQYQYLLDGKWEDLEVRDARIRVKLFGNFYWTVTQERLYSAHGPVIRRDHGTYAIRYAGRDEIDQVDQWLAMNKATDMDSWRAAMRQLKISSFNFVVADRAGNIGYFHNSQSPIRREGFDWQQYLPGDRSDLIWQQYLPFDDLPQVINPKSGFVTSSNQSPFHVTAPEDNLARSEYSETFGFPTRMTNRAMRSLELFTALDRISAEDFRRIKFDDSYSRDSHEMRWLFAINDVDYAEGSPYLAARTFLNDWDLSTDLDSRQAALAVCAISAEWVAEQNGEAPPSVRTEFERCVDLLIAKFGSVDVPWRDVNRLVRGKFNEPVAGGPDVMRAIYGTGLETDGYLTATAGDGLFIFADWDPEGRLTTESIHQFGSATVDPASPHYADQAPLFVAEKMKKTFFRETDLEGNVEREYAP